jgi:hypothetical protein
MRIAAAVISARLRVAGRPTAARSGRIQMLGSAGRAVIRCLPGPRVRDRCTQTSAGSLRAGRSSAGQKLIDEIGRLTAEDRTRVF